jgi:hypothetical protein
MTKDQLLNSLLNVVIGDSYEENEDCDLVNELHGLRHHLIGQIHHCNNTAQIVHAVTHLMIECVRAGFKEAQREKEIEELKRLEKL